MTSFLATFDTKKEIDERGDIVEPAIVFENAVFRCVCNLRGGGHSAHVWSQYPEGVPMRDTTEVRTRSYTHPRTGGIYLTSGG